MFGVGVAASAAARDDRAVDHEGEARRLAVRRGLTRRGIARDVMNDGAGGDLALRYGGVPVLGDTERGARGGANGVETSPICAHPPVDGYPLRVPRPTTAGLRARRDEHRVARHLGHLALDRGRRETTNHSRPSGTRSTSAPHQLHTGAATVASMHGGHVPPEPGVDVPAVKICETRGDRVAERGAAGQLGAGDERHLGAGAGVVACGLAAHEPGTKDDDACACGLRHGRPQRLCVCHIVQTEHRSAGLDRRSRAEPPRHATGRDHDGAGLDDLTRGEADGSRAANGIVLKSHRAILHDIDAGKGRQRDLLGREQPRQHALVHQRAVDGRTVFPVHERDPALKPLGSQRACASVPRRARADYNDVCVHRNRSSIATFPHLRSIPPGGIVATVTAPGLAEGAIANIQEDTMATTQYQVTGMTCSHCENAIRSEVGEIAGVTDIQVSASTGHLAVTTTGDPVDDAAVFAAVDEAGYTAKVA